MANVPYSPIADVQPGPAPDTYQRIQASPEAFGASMGRAAQAVGQGIADIGKAALTIDHIYQTSVVNDGANKVQEKFRTLLHGDPNVTGPDGAPIPGYLATNGRSAMDGRKSIQDQMDTYIKEVGSGMDGRAKEQFMHTANQYRMSALTQVDRHAQQQSLTWAETVNNATAKNAQSDIAVNAFDDEKVNNFTHDLISARVKNLELAGLADNPQILRETIDTANRDALVTRLNAVAVNDPVKAMDILENNKDKAGVLYDDLRGRIRTQEIKVKAPLIVNDLLTKAGIASSGPGAAVFTQTVNVSDSGKPVNADSISSAIIAQESGGNRNAPTSVNGAVGAGQIMPETFARFAKPGERIDNPDDNLAVSKRITDSYAQKYNGDAARVAVAYFSGEGNVSPAGSPTPWISDKADKTGKTTSSYVSDVINRLGGETTVKGQKAAMMMDEASVYSEIWKNYGNDPQMAQAMVQYAIGQFHTARIAQQAQALALKEAQDGVVTDFTRKILFGNVDQSLEQQILTSPSLNGQQMEHLLRLRQQKIEGALKGNSGEYGPEYASLIPRIYGPSDSPNAVTGSNQLLDIYARGGLTPKGFDKALSDIERAKKPDAAGENIMVHNFFKSAERMVTLENPLLNTKMPGAEERWNRALPLINAALDKGRQNGLSDRQMMDPDSKDSVWPLLKPFLPSDREKMAWNMDQEKQASKGQLTPIDLTTQEGVVAAFKSGRLPYAEAKKHLLKLGVPLSSSSEPQAPVR